MSIPTDRYPAAAPLRFDTRLIRDLLAVALVVTGCVCLIVAGFLHSTEAGVAATSVVLILAGVLLALDR